MVENYCGIYYITLAPGDPDPW